MILCAERAPASAVHLIVMSRAPVPGRTKTRLIPAFGAEAAAAFHAACLAEVLAEGDAWRHAVAPQGQARALTLCVTPPESWPDFVRAGIVLPPGAALTVQQGETLGARMAHALHGVLGTAALGSAALGTASGGALGRFSGGATGGAMTGGPALAHAGAALLVGSDLPLLSRSHLEAACAALLGGTGLPDGAAPGADVVLGPAEDGGYYLIGVRAGSRWPELLDAEDWGGGTVLQRTLATAGRIGLTVAQLAPLPDADTPEDLARILAHPQAATGRPSLALVRRMLGAPYPPPRGGC